MTAQILEGKPVAAQLREQLRESAAHFTAYHNRPPQLAVVQVEGDAASERYARGIRRACEQVGIGFVLHRLPADVEQARLNETLAQLSKNSEVDGVLLEVPLPERLSADQALMHLEYHKDIDGIHPLNAGLLAMGRTALMPNTPAGGMELLRFYGYEVAGKHAVVIGRSAVVGRPMATLLLRAHATVTICHSRTPDLTQFTRSADILVAATGRPGLIRGEMLKPGVIVIDFGINVLGDGQVVGDVDFESASQVAGAITPVPGGTGPVTNMMLLRNILRSAGEIAW